MADEMDYLGENKRLEVLEKTIEKTLANVDCLIEINKKNTSISIRSERRR